ncbi:hypothetical protein HOY82DRAFT_544368 [Tuber indicum]|nr:hypothetical protein HOY82DRAFT_544368 [Tuber indicum]
MRRFFNTTTWNCDSLNNVSAVTQGYYDSFDLWLKLRLPYTCVSKYLPSGRKITFQWFPAKNQFYPNIKIPSRQETQNAINNTNVIKAIKNVNITNNKKKKPIVQNPIITPITPIAQVPGPRVNDPIIIENLKLKLKVIDLENQLKNKILESSLASLESRIKVLENQLKTPAPAKLSFMELYYRNIYFDNHIITTFNQFISTNTLVISDTIDVLGTYITNKLYDIDYKDNKILELIDYKKTIDDTIIKFDDLGKLGISLIQECLIDIKPILLRRKETASYIMNDIKNNCCTDLMMIFMINEEEIRRLNENPVLRPLLTKFDSYYDESVELEFKDKEFIGNNKEVGNLLKDNSNSFDTLPGGSFTNFLKINNFQAIIPELVINWPKKVDYYFLKEIISKLLAIRNDLENINVNKGYVKTINVFDKSSYPYISSLVSLLINQEKYNKMDAYGKIRIYN